jgi:hypothetical protein
MIEKDANSDVSNNEFDSSNHVVSHTLNKYQNISKEDNERVKGLIESLPFQSNLLSDNPLILLQEDRVKAAYSIFIDTIIRNLPDIDPNIAKVLVHATIEEILPLIFKTSEEIKHRYQDTGKFEGYEHPEIKEIIEKHLLSNHRKSQSILVKLTKMFGTPIHEIFGKQKYAEGESAMVAKNVHTSISRSGNIVAGALFIEGMSAVVNPILSVISSILLYTGLQILNEYTNEVEHSTVDKRKLMKKFTKWMTILSAKSIPIIMTALSVAALETSNLQERYMKIEGEKLYAEITKRGKDVEASSSRQRQAKDLSDLKIEVNELENQLKTASGNSRNNIIRRLEGLSNGNSTVDETATRPKLKALENKIKTENKSINTLQKEYDDDWIRLGQVGFFQKYADVFLGKDSEAGKEFKKKVQKYNDLPAGTRFENGLGHMGEVLFKLKFNDEILLRIWVAILFESLSIITLVAVQSRMDFTKVVTNSDTQISLGHIVEGAIAFNRQIASITDYNEFRSDEDKKLSCANQTNGSNDSTRFNAEYEKHTKNHDTPTNNLNTKLRERLRDKLWDYFVARPINRITTDKQKYRDEPPSYSSLVNSVSIQKAIAELFREGHIPAFNQIVGDISRGLIHPIPLDIEATSRLKKAKETRIKVKESGEREEALVELFKHDEKLEGDTRYLLNIPRKMIRSLQENILSNDKNSLSTEDLAINLSRIILNETPAKEINHSLLLEELRKEGREEPYLKLLRALQDLNSDIQDVVDNYGATKDRLDLKNKFKDKIRNIIKEFETDEKYSGADEMALIDLAKTFETKEVNLNINYIRTDIAISYIKELTAQKRITPVLLNQIAEGLKTGDAITISSKRKNKELFQKIKNLRLASPYQKSIESCIYEMQKLSTDFMGIRIGWFIGWKKATAFKLQLAEIILKYELASFEEKLKNHQSGS